jgi:hypothetical protein
MPMLILHQFISFLKHTKKAGRTSSISMLDKNLQQVFIVVVVFGTEKE